MRDMSMEFLLCAIYPELKCYPKLEYSNPAILISHFKEDFVLKALNFLNFLCLAQFYKLFFKFFIHSREKSVEK